MSDGNMKPGVLGFEPVFCERCGKEFDSGECHPRWCSHEFVCDKCMKEQVPDEE